MATAGNNEVGQKSPASSEKRPRRSIFRSMSWKRYKRSKMEDNVEEPVNDPVFVKRYERTADQPGMSDDDIEDGADLSKTEGSSKKRKRFAVWRSMKKMFRRKSSKGSKSFTEGDARSPRSYPTRSLSDPNLIGSSSSERPEVAPLEQVQEGSSGLNERHMSVPKKAISHESLISELRGKNSKPIQHEVTVTVAQEPPGIDWQASPSSDPSNFVPGLSASHDKIRVAPRDRRAPSRRGVGAGRKSGKGSKKGDAVPRSGSVGTKDQKDGDRKLGSLKEDNNEVGEHIEAKSKEEKVEEKKNDDEKTEPKEKVDVSAGAGVSKSDDVDMDQGAVTEKRVSVGGKMSESITVVETTTKKHEEIEIKEVRRTSSSSSQKKDLSTTDLPSKVEDKQEKRTSVEIRNSVTTGKDIMSPKSPVESVDGCAVNGTNKEVLSLEVTPASIVSPSAPDNQTSVEKENKEVLSLEVSKETAEKTQPQPVSSSDLKIELDIPKKPRESDTITDPKDVPLPVSPESITSPSPQITDTVFGTAAERNAKPEVTIVETEASVNKSVIEDTEIVTPTVMSEVKSEPVLAEPATRRYSSEKVKNAEEKLVINVPKLKNETSQAEEPKAKALPTKSNRLDPTSPEKAAEKPLASEIVIKEKSEENQNKDKVSENTRSDSFFAHTEKLSQHVSQDDSCLGVSQLTKAFERDHRANTISYGERRRKPDVKPKPKFERNIPDDKSKSLGRNHRFPVTTTTKKENEKPVETSVEKVEKQNPAQTSATTTNAKPKPPSAKPSIKAKPKPLPKPKKDIKILKDESKENKVEADKSTLTNGDQENSPSNNEAEVVMPSFWAKRSVFSPITDKNSSGSPPDSPEKTKPKESSKPVINLKTDSCAVCGTKVYQMEKFKVKDDIVHRSCIKCSVCKRLLSVGNFIMSQNKIYCKPHEPPIQISLNI